MYRDAQEELKRLEEALLEGDNRQDDASQWNIDETLTDTSDLRQKKDKRNKIIFGLTVAVILLTAAMAGMLIFLLAGYGRWF